MVTVDSMILEMSTADTQSEKDAALAILGVNIH
jgi:hypothetical protein